MAISVATQTEHDALAARVQDLETQVQALTHQSSVQLLQLEEQGKRITGLLTYRETSERKIAQQAKVITDQQEKIQTLLTAQAPPAATTTPIS